MLYLYYYYLSLIMVGFTHIVPVGFTSSILAESIRSKPFNKVIVVVGDNRGDKEDDLARATGVELLQKLGDIESEFIEVPSMDVYAAADIISKKMISEKQLGNTVLANLSGSLRTIGIATYVAATLCGVESYIGMPMYRDLRVSGAKKVVDIPCLPIKIMFEDKGKILSQIGEEGKSMVELITSLNPNLEKDDKKYNSERSRISHHIRDLKEDNLVDSKKDGKEVKIKLTDLGKIYLNCLNVCDGSG